MVGACKCKTMKVTQYVSKPRRLLHNAKMQVKFPDKL